MKKIGLLLFTTLLIGAAQAQLQGVLFSEYRMILKNNSIASLQLNNPTKDTRTYNISIIEKQVGNDGEIVDIPDSVMLTSSLKKYLRVFPRTIKLAPGETQEVQIQLRAPASLPNGEYRSYLYFQPLEENGNMGNKSGGGVNMAIKFKIGAALPLFYRKNSELGGVEIKDVKLTKSAKGALATILITREGSRSTYGNIEISGMVRGVPTVLINAPGNAIYPEAKMKNIVYPIPVDQLDRTPDGKVNLKVTYYNNEDKTNLKPIIYTTKTVSVPLPR